MPANCRWMLLALLGWLIVWPVRAGVAYIEAEVDGSDFLYVQGNQIRVEHRNFQPLAGLQSRFEPAGGLPSASVVVSLDRLEGTGPATIVEQPSLSNSYTLKLLVDNDNEKIYPQLYRIRLEWSERGSEMFPTMDRRLYDFCHWRGEVDGTDILRLQGATVAITHVRALPIRSARFDFSAPLPPARVEVYLQVEQARGAVEILQQPTAANNYTLTIRIDDGRFGDSAVYDFYVFWKKGAAPSPRDPEEMDFLWEGRVDGADQVVIRGKSAQIEHLQSQLPDNVQFKFRKVLPQREQTVSLEIFKARGEVRILEQPSRQNGYSVKVLVDDSDDSGASVYQFGLRWEGGGRSDAGPDAGRGPARAGVIRWRGRVDGRDRLHIQGKILTVEHLDANPIRDMTTTFTDPLPDRAVTATINKLEGRGDVVIIQQPSRENGFTLVVEISDPKSGASTYEFEIIW
jgi:hypothetical protein